MTFHRKSLPLDLVVLAPPNRVLESGTRVDHFGYQPGFVVGHWAPWVRIIAGSAGLLLLAQGLRKRGSIGTLASVLGTALLSRSVTNRDLVHLVGAFALPVARMERTVDVDAPIEAVFSFWKHFENYPKFMSFIHTVEVNDTGSLRWVAMGPGRSRVQWDTTVFDYQHNQRISWKSVPGSAIATEGVILMESLGWRTRVHVELSYAPPVGALGYAAFHILGFDPRTRIDEDLQVMRRLIEKQEARGVDDFHKSKGQIVSN